MLCSFRYVLYGAVAYITRYYVAYVRCVKGIWEVHNDMKKKYTHILNLSNVQIMSHLLIYALK